MKEYEYAIRKDILVRTISSGSIRSCKSCINDEICSKCGGNCCKNEPCILSPDEFLRLNDITYMSNILDMGLLSIAPLTLRQDVFGIRVRGKFDFDTVVTGYCMHSNSCILHTKKGCLLGKTFRPTEGLMLMPEENRNGQRTCSSEYPLSQIITDWRKVQKEVLKLKHIYDKKTVKKTDVYPAIILKYQNKILGE